MLNSKRKIFRDESLERLSSPEALDQLMKVISPKSLLPVAAIGIISIVGGTWSVFGRIPVTVEGQGILMHPSNVVPLQIKSAGQLSTINIKANDIVKKNQVIGTIDQSELRKQLQQQKNKLQELQSQNLASKTLQLQVRDREKQLIAQQRKITTARIQELQSLAPILKSKSQQSIREQRRQLEQKVAGLQALSPILKQKGQAAIQQQRLAIKQQIRMDTSQLPVLQSRATKFKEIFAKGVISQETYLRAEQEYQKKQEDIAQLNTQLREADTKENDVQERYINNLNDITRSQADLQKLEQDESITQETYLRNQNEIAKLQTELEDLNSREATQSKQSFQDTTTRDNQVAELQREITKLEIQIGNSSQLISPYSGRVLEVTQRPGEVVAVGGRLATIEVENSTKALSSITYFTVAEGKKIQPGMSIQLTPQTVKRERFGGIVGKIIAVSRFPITSETVAHEIGNSDLAYTLAKKREGLIQVTARLERDSKTPSGYQWSSSTGPAGKITPGTTTVVRVKVEERAPITFVLPILRSVSGLD
ncbi:MAG: NHLP bacteriocin system secretion protein [Chamaesiphon sp.]|nr:NHLP bacteriocin system secretion protein [Chamaesiphon sp.]